MNRFPCEGFHLCAKFVTGLSTIFHELKQRDTIVGAVIQASIIDFKKVTTLLTRWDGRFHD